MLLLNNDEAPLNVHCEVRVEGRADAGRLVGAIRAAALRHPLARARLASLSPIGRRFNWELSDRLDRVPFEVVDCADDDAYLLARERLLHDAPALDTPGPFRLMLAHRPAGDSIVLNFHHAAGDGVSTCAFMASILRAYAGEADPPALVDQVAVRDVRRLVGRSLGKRLRRARGATDFARRLLRPPTRLALP